MDPERLPIDTNEYVDKIREKEFKVPEEEVEASLERLNEPFEKIDEKGDGFVEIQFNDATVEIKYVQLPPGGWGNLARIEKLSFKTKDKEVDLIQELPENTTIRVDQDCTGTNRRGDARFQTENGVSYSVLFEGKIVSPYDLFALLHEIGHVFDFKKLVDLGRGSLDDRQKGMMDDGLNAELAEGIREERAANAFALKFIKPYLSDKQQRRDATNMLIQYSLKSHYEGVRDRIG